MATTLMKIINHIREDAEQDGSKRMTTSEIIDYIESQLPSEETMIRDAWIAACRWKDGYSDTNDKSLDLSQYITNLKK